LIIAQLSVYAAALVTCYDFFPLMQATACVAAQFNYIWLFTFKLAASVAILALDHVLFPFMQTVYAAFQAPEHVLCLFLLILYESAQTTNNPMVFPFGLIDSVIIQVKGYISFTFPQTFSFDDPTNTDVFFRNQPTEIIFPVIYSSTAWIQRNLMNPLKS